MQKNRILALALAGILATAAPALAEKPSWAGGGKKDKKHEKSEKHEKYEDSRHGGHDSYDDHDGHHGGITANIYFGDRQRETVHHYYSEQFRSGHCPPGLAKKKNGCMPPGQAKKWARGKQLPRDFVFYDLPSEVLVQLGPPPEHHRFVRVANDILLITVGTGMVVDAIQDLSNY